MKKYLNFIITLISLLCFSQEEKKIDSVFSLNFHILEIELKGNNDFAKDKKLYDEIILDNGQINYINKYLAESIIFFENITKIKAKREHKALSINPYVDRKILRKWKKWYALNKAKVVWCIEENTPCLK